MKPGVVYTAPDGSTVELQLFIEEHEPWSDEIVYYRSQDRMRDVRLLMTRPDGRCAAVHLHSPTKWAYTMVTMYDNIHPPLHAKDGVVSRPEEWTRPLAEPDR